MNPFSKPKPRLTAVLLAVLIVAGGIPFVVGSHVNDLAPWRQVQDEPTGNSLLDAAIGSAAGVLDNADDQFLNPLREGPQVPATFFHDIFKFRTDEDGRQVPVRTGGWGDWQNQPGWSLSPDAGGRHVQVPWLMPAGGTQFLEPASGDRRDIERGFRIGGPDGYPLPGDEGAITLVSPLISLRSLPVDLPSEANRAPVGPGSGEQDLTAAKGTRPCCDANVDYADRVILYMDHRFNLAFDNANNGDGGRVIVIPEGGTAQIIDPLRAINYSFSPRQAFMGELDKFTEEAFDLTAWAGQDVRLAFELRSFGQPARPFDDCEPFCGWDISNVRVEGPAHLHNVRLDRVLYPTPADGQTLRDGDYVARADDPDDPEPLRVLLLNRGQVNETVDVIAEVEATDADGTVTEWTCDAVTAGLPPGGAKEIVFKDRTIGGTRADCLTVEENGTYEVAFRTELQDAGHEDLYPTDDQMAIKVREDGPDVTFVGGLHIDPTTRFIDPGSLVSLNATLANHGFTEQDIGLSLRIDYKHPNSTDFDVDQQHDESLVRFPHPDPTAVNQTKTVPEQQPGQPPGAKVFTWNFTLEKAGLYQITVTADTGDQRALLMGVRNVPELAYQTSFEPVGDGIKFTSNSFAKEDQWTTWDKTSMLDPLDALQTLCRLDEDDDVALLGNCRAWELRSNLPRENLAPASASPFDSGLRGDFEIDQVDAATNVTDLVVEVQHQVLDLRCSTRHFNTPASRSGPEDFPQRCDVPMGNSATNHPEDSLSIALVEGLNTVGNTQTTFASVPQDVTMRGLQHVGGSHYRNAYYTGQWITERFEAPICGQGWRSTSGMNPPAGCSVSAAADMAGGVHAGLLAGMALEFRMRGERECPLNSGTGNNTSCPTWRVADATVVGINRDDPDVSVELLRWSGVDDADEHGTWSSYFHPGGSRQQVSVFTIYSARAGDSSFAPCDLGAVDTEVDAEDPQNEMDEVNETAEASNRLRCPPWRLQGFDELVGSAGGHTPTWRLDDGGFWTNSERPRPDKLGARLYSENPGTATIDLLTSPVFEVPDGEPTMSFDHRFQLHPYRDSELCRSRSCEWYTVWRSSPSYADSGMLMVRFYNDTEPNTPWLPVHLDGGRFMGEDCTDYYTEKEPDGSAGNLRPRTDPHPNRAEGCEKKGLMERLSVTEQFDLRNFPILDYRDFDILPNSTFDFQKSTFVNGNGGRGSAYSPDTEGDANGALTHTNLQQCTPDGLPGATNVQNVQNCWVQFAFRLEVPDPDPGRDIDHGEEGKQDFTGFKDNLRDDLIEEADEADTGYGDPTEGWFIDAFQITAEKVTDFDLELVDVTIDTAYDWQELGLGPKSKAVANLTVKNNGLFPVESALFTVAVQNADTGNTTTWEQKSGPDFVLTQNETTYIEIPLELPSEGMYRIVFGADLLGFLIGDLVLEDMERGNDCMALTALGKNKPLERNGTTGACAIADALPVDVFPNPDLRLELDVTPLAGRKGQEFPRGADLWICNDGNVDVEGAMLKLVLRKPSGNTDTDEFILERSPSPGDCAPWGTADARLLDPSDGISTKAPTSRIRLAEDGTYFLTAFLGPADDWGTRDQVRLDAFDTVYADAFEEGSTFLTDQKDMVKVTGEDAVEAVGQGWQRVSEVGSDPELGETGVWRFGDAETGRYQDGADAMLYLPPVDLSPARRASFSLSHNHAFEGGFDGARVEACMGEADSCNPDNGTWLPLEPRNRFGGRGYPGTVSAASPLNADNDPRVQAPAFTGSSTGRSASGWVQDEFDFAQLPGFTTLVVLERFALEGMKGPHKLDEGVVFEDRVSYHPDWRESSAACPDACWYRENLNKGDPPPLPGSETFFWSGSAGEEEIDDDIRRCGHPCGPSTTLSIDLDLTNLVLEDDEFFRIAFSLWKDESGEFTATLNGETTIAEHGHDSATGGWAVKESGPLDATGDYTLELTFQDFLDEGFKSTNLPNRGAALDDFKINVYARDDAGRDMSRGSYEILRGEDGFDASHDWVDEITATQDDLVNADGESLENKNLKWTPVAAIDAASEHWGIDPVTPRHRGGSDVGPVWRFGKEIVSDDEFDGKLTYPGNARERLVTPPLDLREVSGETATFAFWERYEIMEKDTRCVLIQVVEDMPDGTQRFSDWEVLGEGTDDEACWTSSDEAFSGGDGCRNDWCPVALDISQYRGMQVRLAFEIATTRLTPAPSDEDWHRGWHWAVDEVSVEADSLLGGPVRLRLRAATDGSISEGHWLVENVQLVAKVYQEGNVALVPDDPPADQPVRPEGKLVLTGQVRNLGPNHLENPEDRMRLRLFDCDESEDNKDLEVTIWVGGQRHDSCVADGITLKAFGTSQGGGEPLDRVPYRVEVEFPSEEIANELYTLRLGVEYEGGDPLGDESVEDDGFAFDATIDSETNWKKEDGHLSVYPPTVAANENASILFDLHNTGVFDVDADILLTADRLDEEGGDLVVIFDNSLERLQAGAQRVFDWTWTSDEAGFYRISATVTDDDDLDRNYYTHLLVDKQPLWHVDDDPGSTWKTEATDCSPSDEECWGASAVYRDRAAQSLFVGNDQDSSGYLPAGNARATWPSLDNLSQLARDSELDGDIRKGKSPFSPYLSLRYLAMLDTDQERHRVQVMGKSVSEDPTDPNPCRSLQTRDVQTDLTGAQGLTGRDESEWRVASFPLFDGGNTVLGDGVALLGDHEVSFCLQAPWGTPGSGRGFALDSATVSSYDVEVSPRTHETYLRPGSDKVFYFHVENTGAARDTYHVSIDEDRTGRAFQDGVATLELLNENGTLALEPGESGLAAVRVAVPFKDVDPIVGDVVLNIVSAVDPNRIATGVVDFEEFVRDDLANLVTDVRRPGGEDGPVGEGEQATFIVTVTNDGRLASRPTELALFACPTRYDDSDGVTRDLSIQKCGQREMAIPLGEAEIPRLVSSRDAGEGNGHVATYTFTWIPALGDHDTYRVVAVADPRHVVTQFDRDTSVDELELIVAPIARPDLNVDQLQVTDVHGNPVTHAFAGDVLRIEGMVRNDGNTVAHNTKVRIVNQFVLREERVGELHPGQWHELSAQWIAQPGNWVVLFEASTSDVEIAGGEPNAMRWSLAIRSGTLDADWEPDLLHLDPGDSGEAVLRVVNRRDEAADLAVASSADGITVQGLPDTVRLSRGQAVELPVDLVASPFSEAGRQTVRVDLVHRGTGNTLASAALEVHVGAQRSLHLSSEPIHTPPGTAQMPLTLHNSGTAPESVALRVGAPADWTATVLQPTLRVPPDADRTAQVVLEIPAGTPAGRYPLEVDAGDDLLNQTVHVDVLRQPVWRSEVQAVYSMRDQVEILVRVENAGNAPAAPPFQADAGDAPYSIDPVPATHEPGEGRTYHLRLLPADGASLFLPGQDDPAPVELRPTRPDVVATGLDAQNAGTVAAGDHVGLRLGLRSAGADAQHALPVRFWVDGILAAEQRVDLAPGEERDVDFRWKAAQAGARVVTATVGSDDESVARTFVLEVTPSPDGVGVPGPGIPFVIAVLALAVVAAGRRRRP